MLLIRTVKAGINSPKQLIIFMNTFLYVSNPGHTDVISVRPKCHPKHQSQFYISMTTLMKKARKVPSDCHIVSENLIEKRKFWRYVLWDIGEGTP